MIRTAAGDPRKLILNQRRQFLQRRIVGAPPIEEQRRDRRTPDTVPRFYADRSLALVFAHELGHVLLPEYSHSFSRLMRANWEGRVAKVPPWV